MKEISKHGVRKLNENEIDVIYDPPGHIGYTQELFLRMSPKKIPIKIGVYRFKSHEDMNRHWEDAMDKMVEDRQKQLLGSGKHD